MPLALAAVGIVFRGATYALRVGTTNKPSCASIDTSFAMASLLTPFFLGAAIGAVPSDRLGLAAANASWLSLASLLAGALSVCVWSFSFG